MVEIKNYSRRNCNYLILFLNSQKQKKIIQINELGAPQAVAGSLCLFK